MCKFEIFSQKYAFSFMALCVHFPLRLNHLGAPPLDYARRLPRPWQIAPLNFFLRIRHRKNNRQHTHSPDDGYDDTRHRTFGNEYE